MTNNNFSPHFKLAIFVLSLFGSQQAFATDKYWVCSNGSWDNASCWSTISGGIGGIGQPAHGDSVYLSQSDSVNRAVTYANTLYPSAILGNLTINATGLGSITLSQSKDPLSSGYEYVGTSGNGTYNQSGGTNTVLFGFYLGYATNGNGNYNLSGTGTLNTSTQYIGMNGKGTFTQSGGTNTISQGATPYLYLGNNSGSNGTYNLQAGSLSTDGVMVGYSGTGTFNQNGGINKVRVTLGLGYNSGGSGTYTLSGTSILDLSSGGAGFLSVGSSGTGVFTQTGGIVTTGTNLDLGVNNGSNGIYNLQAGNLSVGYDESIGKFGSGTFTQSGGTNTLSNYLYLGIGNGSNGTYNLQAGNLQAGNLSSGGISVGNVGTGVFNQSGGTNTVHALIIGAGGVPTGSSGTYNLSGASSLSVNIEYIGQARTGTFNQNGGAHTVTDLFVLGYYNGFNGIYNLQTGNLSTNNENLGYSGIGTFNQYGGAHTVSNTLTVGTWAESTGTYNLNGGTLSTGNIVKGAGNSTLNINGGTLTVGSSNGTINVDNLNLGSEVNTSGIHALSGTGTIAVANETIGNFGTGNFTQNGGTHTVFNMLTLAAHAGSSGAYSLNGGTLNVGQIIRGTGTSAFNWSTGTLNLTASDLAVGTGGLLGATLVLNANKNLSAPNETIAADGTINHTGGTNTITNALTVAANAGSSGTYNLIGGTLHAANITVNSGGTFNFNGGTLAVAQFTGNLTNLGGTLAPGKSPGTTNITGNYTQSSAGSFAVEIGGTGMGQFDSLHVSGIASLSGTLNVSLFDLGSGLFTPQAGDSFDILTAEQLQGSFSLLALAALDPNFKWEISYLTDAIGTTDVVRLSVNAVPVPPALWLFGSGLLGLMGFIKKNRINRCSK